MQPTLPASIFFRHRRGPAHPNLRQIRLSDPQDPDPSDRWAGADPSVPGEDVRSEADAPRRVDPARGETASNLDPAAGSPKPETSTPSTTSQDAQKMSTDTRKMSLDAPRMSPDVPKSPEISPDSPPLTPPPHIRNAPKCPKMSTVSPTQPAKTEPPASPEPKQATEKPITTRQRTAATYLALFGSISKTAKVVDVHPKTIRRWLKTPAFEAEYLAQKEEFYGLAKAQIFSLVPRATSILSESMEAQWFTTRLDAAKIALATALKLDSRNQPEHFADLLAKVLQEPKP